MSKVVAITGAAGGIGRALAEAFAAEGARLVLLDLDEGALADMASALEAGGTEVMAARLDVTDAAACTEVLHRVRSKFGRLDVLINNAGITHFSAIEATDDKVLRQVMEVNFFGAVNVTKAALDLLIHSKGQVIAMSSVAGFCPLPLRAGYVASKHAMKGYFETLRSEFKSRGLRVLVVCPFFVDTDIGRNALSGDGVSKKPELEDTRAKGMVTATSVAAEIVKASAQDRRFLAAARGGKLAWILSRVAPNVLADLSAKRVYGTSDLTVM